MGRALVTGIANGGIYGLMALGIVLVYRGSRVLNFALGEIGTFGLFIAWAAVEAGAPWWVGGLMAVAAGAAIGLLFEGLVVRRMVEASRLAVAVATVGLFLLLLSIEFKIWGVAPRILAPPIEGRGVEVLDFILTPTYILGLATVALLGFGLAAFLRRTDFGLGVLAAAQDASAVRLVGISLSHVSMFTWGAAAVVSVIAALLIEPSIGAFAPGFMTLLFIRGLAAALLGGLTSLPGAFVGGIAVGILESIIGTIFIGQQFPGIQSIAIFVVIIAVLLFRPQGILYRARGVRPESAAT